MKGIVGVTLVELLVAMLLGLVAVAAAWGVVAAAQGATARAARTAAAARAAADAVDQLARDVRDAGHDPRGAGVVALVDAAATRLELTADLDADGAVDLTSEEHVTWRLGSGGRTLQRIVGAQTLPMVSDLAPGGFRLRYHDTDGRDVDPATPEDRATVRLVAVELRVRDGVRTDDVVVAGGARLLAGDVE